MNDKLHFQLKLILSTTLIGFNQIMIGCSIAFSSILFLQLREPSSTIKLNREQASWIASIPVLVCPFGVITFGILMDKFGRRKILQVTYIPVILSWLILAFADSYKTILIGRIILGISFGTSASVHLYVAEVSPAEQRSLFGSLSTVFLGVGTLVQCLLSIFFHWNTVSLLLGIASTCGCLLLFFVPEPPLWLYNRGWVHEAERAEKWFGRKYPVIVASSTAVTVISDQVQESVAIDDNNKNRQKQSTTCWWSTYTHPTVWKPTAITLVFFCCQQFSGFFVLLFYSVDVLRDCRIPWNGIVVTLFLFGVRVVSSIVYASMHRFQRKTLAVASCTGMTISLAVIVAYTKWTDGRDVSSFDATVLIVAFTAYVFFGQIGILPMPWTLCGELFPIAVKGTMNGVVRTCGFLIMFIVIKIYPMMVSSLGIQCVWSIFSVVCILSMLFCIFILPETQGIPLDVILTYFQPHKKINKINLP